MKKQKKVKLPKRAKLVNEYGFYKWINQESPTWQIHYFLTNGQVLEFQAEKILKSYTLYRQILPL